LFEPGKICKIHPADDCPPFSDRTAAGLGFLGKRSDLAKSECPRVCFKIFTQGAYYQERRWMEWNHTHFTQLTRARYHTHTHTLTHTHTHTYSHTHKHQLLINKGALLRDLVEKLSACRRPDGHVTGLFFSSLPHRGRQTAKSRKIAPLKQAKCIHNKRGIRCLHGRISNALR
jgi:hypothetical protein